MSAIELMNHPDCEDLLEDAFDYQSEKADGEHLFKINKNALTPVKKRMQKEQEVWDSIK